MPFFPLGGFTPLRSSALGDVAARHGATPMQVALAWLLHRSPNVLLIPGTSSLEHLRENLASASLVLSADDLIGSPSTPETSAPQTKCRYFVRPSARSAATTAGRSRTRPWYSLSLLSFEMSTPTNPAQLVTVNR